MNLRTPRISLIEIYENVKYIREFFYSFYTVCYTCTVQIARVIIDFRGENEPLFNNSRDC